MIKLLVADDHAIIRQGIGQLVAETGDIMVAGEAMTGQEVLSKTEESKYDVVLLDISMPGRDGIDILRELKHRHPALKVLVLSMHQEVQYALQALRFGADGYLTKECAIQELVAAIRSVATGAKYLNEVLAEKIAKKSKLYCSDRLPHELLSRREYEVMCMIAVGKSQVEIANELSLSSNTIKNYRKQILDKMRMDDNTEIVRYAIINGLVK